MDEASDIRREVPGHGIWLFRASRIESLLDPLLALLDSSPPASVLAPQTVIVAHPGMRRWLLDMLARERGTAGIVANLDVVLPSAWLDRLAQTALGDSDVVAQPYRREFLRWRIHEFLGDVRDPATAAYLRGHDAPRRRFQLADRIAHVFTQYLVYRPDWLDAWAAGRDPVGDASLLASLWKRVRTAIGKPHRGERVASLVDRLARMRDLGDDTPLHVFGLSHIAPAELAVLRAVARHRPVVFHVPDPCREFWAGMPDERTRLRELAMSLPDETTTESAFLQLDHPLLANWGRIGQHFLLLLEDSEAAIDIRHHRDQPEAGIAPRNRLEWLQEGIRRSRPDLAPPPEATTREDASLRVHACHTRLRELEVLRDALLLQLRQQPDLKPSDILVMAPDIRAYAPLLPAVFGAPARRAGPLPWQLADVTAANAHPLLDAFARLLELPQSRMTAPEVADLLALAPIADRLGLSRQDAETLVGWLREARVAWGLDAAFRARLGVPAIAEQTLSWGMDRLLAGYTMGDCEDHDEGRGQVASLPDGSTIAPLPGVAGAQAALAGVLDTLLVELAQWCEAGRATRPASAWADWLDARCDALLRIDPGDPEAREAETALRRAIRRVANEPGASRLDPPLAFAVVRELLLAALAEVPARQAFLSGGATFCGMVPQRAIPFRVIAVLGLDDGALPRPYADDGLDPMATHRRIGDRDVRNDDRWLFLQVLMSARETLHLSYIGEGVRDGRPRNPAAPLAELIALLDPDPSDLSDADDDGDAARAQAIARRPWFVRHPLQPFDARYFDGADPALFSFNADFAELDPQLSAPVVATAAYTDAPMPTIAEAAPGTIVVPLRALLAWFRDPARHFLTQRVQLRLDALEEDRLRDSESLDARTDAIDRIARGVFLQALADPSGEPPAGPPPWLASTGALPPGRLGAKAWEDECDKVRELLAASAGHALFADGMPPRARIAVDLAIGPWRVDGEPGRVHAQDGTLWVFDVFPGKSEDDLDLGRRIGLFLEWALLRLADGDGAHAVRLCAVCKGDTPWQDAINTWDRDFVQAASTRQVKLLAAHRAGLETRLRMLLELWSRAQERPQPYFPRTSWIAANKPDRIVASWIGDDYRDGERDHAPGYARLLAGETRFDENDPARVGLIELANALHAAIDPRAWRSDGASP